MKGNGGTGNNMVLAYTRMLRMRLRRVAGRKGRSLNGSTKRTPNDCFNHILLVCLNSI